MPSRSKWKWFGHVGHLCVGRDCEFHLCTQVGKYLVSTLGDYWPERPVREIHAQIHDPKWFEENRHLRGDSFDVAYMQRFGYQAIGAGENSLYETLVFHAGPPCSDVHCGSCGLPRPVDWSEVDGRRYKTAAEATKGHYDLCEKWSKKR